MIFHSVNYGNRTRENYSFFWMSLIRKGQHRPAKFTETLPVLCLNFECNHPHQIKWRIAQSLYSRAVIICQEQEDLISEIDGLRCGFIWMGIHLSSLIQLSTNSWYEIFLKMRKRLLVCGYSLFEGHFWEIPTYGGIATMSRWSSKQNITLWEPDR